MKNNEWGNQMRFEALFVLTAITLIIVGQINGNAPLAIVGFSIIMLVLPKKALLKGTSRLKI